MNFCLGARKRSFFGFIAAVAMAAASCQPVAPQPQPVSIAERLSTGLEGSIVATANHVLDQRRLTQGHGDGNQIPRELWGAAIIDLHPIGVEDRGHLVVVLKDDGSVEERLIVWTDTASMAPANNTGETFERLVPGGDGRPRPGSLVTTDIAVGSSIFHYRGKKDIGVISTQPDVGGEQWVPFSHSHHVRGLGIDCRYCHTPAEKSYFVGFPPAEICANCHSKIGADVVKNSP